MRPETARVPQNVARQTTPIILILFSCIILLKFIHKISDPRYVGGNLVGLGLNYIQFGAVRRGLAGSILYLSGVNLVAGARLVYWVSYILFLSLAYLILKRMTAVARFFVPFVIILAALLLFWSTDIGRTDMLIAAILAGAALAAIDGRIITASVCVGAGYTVHEAVAIFGLPLLFAILLDEDRYKTSDYRLPRSAEPLLSSVLWPEPSSSLCCLIAIPRPSFKQSNQNCRRVTRTNRPISRFSSY